MIAVISSKRYAELLAKERQADAINEQTLYTAAWSAIPGINAQQEIDALCTQLLLAQVACDQRSPIRSIISQCQRHAANLHLGGAMSRTIVGPTLEEWRANPDAPLRFSDDAPQLDQTGRIGGWMQTSSGRPFWPLSPRPEDFDICDIAHALSMLCRFGGHCSRYYSVAEHSVLVSRVVPPELALCGLMHDATEAYCVDVPRPLKRELPQYNAIESGLWMAIAERFNLPDPMPPEVHAADSAVLLAEKKVLLCESPGPWDIPGVPADVPIVGYPPDVAKDLFLARFAQLLGQDMQRRRQRP